MANNISITKSEALLHTLLRIIVIIALLGAILLLWLNRNAALNEVAFDLFAYIVSITALALTTLQSIAISRQVRITKYAASKVSQSIEQLDELVAADQQLAKVVGRDTELEEKIIAVFQEHDVGITPDDRKKIAQAVSRHVKNNQ